MADTEPQVMLRGKDINDYRVVDLKKECDKRGLSKSGNKQEIVERLRTFLSQEQQKENEPDDEEGRISMTEEAEKNDVIKSYLEKQKKLIADRQEEIRRFSEESASEDGGSPLKKEKQEISPEKVSEQKNDGGGDSVITRRRSNSSNHSNTDETTTPKVKSPVQQRPKRGWRKYSKEETFQSEELKTEDKSEPVTETETQISVRKGEKDTIEESKDEEKDMDEKAAVNDFEQDNKVKERVVESTVMKSDVGKDPDVENEKVKTQDAKKSAGILDEVDKNGKSNDIPKRRARSSSSEGSEDSDREIDQTGRPNQLGSGSDRTRSKEIRRSRASSSSSSSSSKSQSPARRSSSSSRSRSRSKSPVKEVDSTKKEGLIQRKSRSKSPGDKSSSPSAMKIERSASSRSPSPKPNEEMTIEEPVSTTKEVQQSGNTSTMELEDNDSKPDTTVGSADEKEINKKQTSESGYSPEETKQQISSTVSGKEDEEKSEDKENLKEKPVRKRKWGSKTGQQTGHKRISSINISTDSLKGLIPDVKMTEPILDLGIEDDKISDTEEDKRDVKIRRTVVVKEDQAKDDLEEGEAPESPEEGEAVEEEEEEKMLVEKEEGKDERKVQKAEPVVIRRVSEKKSLIETEEPSKVKSRSPSPARNPVSKIVHLRNLVRPFTLLQLKDLLKRTGTLINEKFWIDSIKSHCYATYETEEQALETRKALHGTRWPSSNPKILQVDYATTEEIEYHKNEEEAPKIAREKALKEAKARKEEEKKRKAEREARIAKRKEDEAKKKAPPIREWDRDKIRQSEERDDPNQGHRRKSSESPIKDRKRRDRSREKEKDRSIKKDKTDKKDEGEPPAKLLDDLFKKTKATPCIYWLPLTEAQAAEKAKQREAEREKRLKEREKKKEGQTSLPHRDMDRRPLPSPPRRRMDDWSRRRSPDRRMPPGMRGRRR